MKTQASKEATGGAERTEWKQDRLRICERTAPQGCWGPQNLLEEGRKEEKEEKFKNKIKQKE